MAESGCQVLGTVAASPLIGELEQTATLFALSFLPLCSKDLSEEMMVGGHPPLGLCGGL